MATRKPKGVSLGGAVVLLTGGAGGIGTALAATARAHGATVVTADLPGTDADVEVDVTDRESVTAAVATTIERHGRIDVGIANAGIAVGGLVEDMTPADWDRVLGVNLHGTVHTVEAIYPHLVGRGRGAMVLVASLAGLLPAPLLVPYGVSKAGVVALAGGLRVEGARHGVGVTVVCPGPVETPLLDEGASTPGVNVRRHITRSAGKPITPQRLADQVCAAIESNRALVTPGQAGVLARLQRLVPGVAATAVGLNLRRELSAAK